MGSLRNPAAGKLSVIEATVIKATGSKLAIGPSQVEVCLVGLASRPVAG
jgi:hypothetical protein